MINNPFRAVIESGCARIESIIALPIADYRPAERLSCVQGILKEVLAAELACVQRYRREYAIAKSLYGASAAQSFLDLAMDEEAHVCRVGHRLAELGVSVTEQRARVVGLPERVDDYLEDMVSDDLVAESMIADTYDNIARWLCPEDQRTATMLREMADDERHHYSE